MSPLSRFGIQPVPLDQGAPVGGLLYEVDGILNEKINQGVAQAYLPLK